MTMRVMFDFSGVRNVYISVEQIARRVFSGWLAFLFRGLKLTHALAQRARVS